MTYMLLLNCELKLVEEIILYYDARSKKHQITEAVLQNKYDPFLVSQVGSSLINRVTVRYRAS